MPKPVANLFSVIMKIKIFLLVLIVATTLIGESYGQRQAAPQEDPSLPEVALQLLLKNSDGQIITYLEPSTMYILNLYRTHEFLDTKDSKIVEIDGENFEVIEYNQQFRFAETRQIATYGMWYDGGFPLLFRHDAFLTAPGDTLYVHWEIIRTI